MNDLVYLLDRLIGAPRLDKVSVEDAVGTRLDLSPENNPYFTFWQGAALAGPVANVVLSEPGPEAEAGPHLALEARADKPVTRREIAHLYGPGRLYSATPDAAPEGLVTTCYEVHQRRVFFTFGAVSGLLRNVALAEAS